MAPKRCSVSPILFFSQRRPLSPPAAPIAVLAKASCSRSLAVRPAAARPRPRTRYSAKRFNRRKSVEDRDSTARATSSMVAALWAGMRRSFPFSIVVPFEVCRVYQQSGELLHEISDETTKSQPPFSVFPPGPAYIGTGHFPDKDTEPYGQRYRTTTAPATPGTSTQAEVDHNHCRGQRQKQRGEI